MIYFYTFLVTLLFLSSSENKAVLENLLLLEDVHQIAQYNWVFAILSYLNVSLCKIVASRRSNVTGCVVLLQVHVNVEHIHLMIHISFTNLS